MGCCGAHGFLPRFCAPPNLMYKIFVFHLLFFKKKCSVFIFYSELFYKHGSKIGVSCWLCFCLRFLSFLLLFVVPCDALDRFFCVNIASWAEFPVTIGHGLANGGKLEEKNVMMLPLHFFSPLRFPFYSPCFFSSSNKILYAESTTYALQICHFS